MSETNIAIKTLNGHPLADTVAREKIEKLTTTEPNMHLVTDADGVMTWELKDGRTLVMAETTFAITSNETYITESVFAAMPTVNNICEVVWNGVSYKCEAVDPGSGMLVLGNLSYMGESGGNAEAPFCLMIVPPEMLENTGGMYGGIATDDTAVLEAQTVTISIVDTGEGGTQPGVNFVVNVTMNASDSTFNDCTADKTFSQVVAALDEGKNVVCYLRDNDNSSLTYVLRVVGYTASEVMFCAYMALSEVDASLYLIYKPDSLTGAMRYLT